MDEAMVRTRTQRTCRSLHFEPIDRFVLNRFGPALSAGRATKEVIAFMWAAHGRRVSRPANMNMNIEYIILRPEQPKKLMSKKFAMRC